MRPSILAALALAAGLSCSSPKATPPPAASSAPSASAASAIPGAGAAWETGFDFDGDARPDRVEIDFTGGAHCCYRLAVALSSGRRVALPFELDGGYPRGLDRSQPDRFDVVALPDGRAELRMEIATGNGVAFPIPIDWTQRFGVQSHRIAVRFDASGFHVTNLGWRCEAALLTARRRLWAAWEGLPGDCTVERIGHTLDAVAGGETPALLGADRRPAVRVHFEPGDAEAGDTEVALVGGRVVWMALAAGGEADPRFLAGAFGEAGVRLGGLLVWARRGIAVRIDRGGRPATVELFAATDLEAFRRELQPP